MSTSIMPLEGIASPKAHARLDKLERSIADALLGIRPGHRRAEGIPDNLVDLVLAHSVLGTSSKLSVEVVTTEARRLRAQSPLEVALQQSSDAHAVALKEVGFSPAVLDILRSWVELQVEGRVLQQQLDLDRLVSRVADVQPVAAFVASDRNPGLFLSAAELANKLNISDETVRRRETDRELFSILRPGRKRGREYPVFQAWPEVVGEPLTKVLAALDPELGSATYGFFVGANDLLAGLTPVEVLCGAVLSSRQLEDAADEILACSSEKRLEAVIRAAKSYVLGS